MQHFWMVLVGGAMACLPASGAFATQYTSQYSDLDFDKCTIVEEDSEVGFVEMRCAGAYGYDVLASDADARLYLAYVPESYVVPPAPEELLAVDGAKNGDMPSAEAIVDAETGVGIGQTISYFNTAGPKIEWRAANVPNAEPFATIVRYHYQTQDEEGGFVNNQALVVSRFRMGHSCHVAYIDALANADANLMAREVADKFASSGDCPEGTVPVLGSGGAALRF